MSHISAQNRGFLWQALCDTAGISQFGYNGHRNLSCDKAGILWKSICMLEWIRERNQGWLAKIILTLVTVPFALFGINSYFNHNAGADVVATVDGQKISMLTYEHAIKQQAERLRATLGPDAVKAMDDPRMRKEVLDSLVRQRAMVAEAQRLGMVVSDSQLATFIGAIPAFQKNGKFDLETYQMVLRQQGLAVKQFEQMARDELMMQDLRAAFADAQQIPSVSARLFFAAFDQQREISAVTLQVKDQPVVVPDDAKIAAYYKAHIADFTLPMRAKFAYLVLSEDSLASQIKVSDTDIKAWYDEHLAQYAQPETRQARHILVAVSPADNAQKHAAALKQAQDIQQQLQQHPERFAALAKQYSADPGSAAQGGDLGWFERGAMVKPFADAVYSMKLNAISPPVLSDFGYHIIQLTGVRPAVTRDLASVRDDIVAELQKQRAEKQFADAAERFSNQVFEQSDDLAPTAKSLGLVEQTSGWVTRSGSETSLLAGDKIRQALFSDDVLKHRHNTAAIEVSPNVLVAARLLQSEPARVQSLAEVKPQIIVV